MFVERKLKKLRKLADKEINRTHKCIEKHTDRFNADSRKAISLAEQELTKAMEYGDPAEISGALKNYKRTVDLYVPFWQISIVREYAEAIVIALILALIIRAYFIQAFKIPSGSMIPTLLVGDHIVVDKLTYGFKVPFVDKKILPMRKPKRGDVIVFKFPEDTSKDFIKRLIGLPGDLIEVRGPNLFINGKQMSHKSEGKFKYEDTFDIPVSSNLFIEDLEGVNHQILQDRLDPDGGLIKGIGSKLTFTVPPDKYFMMGDNRDRSNDSRYWGFVDFNLIKGKALFIYFSWPPRQLLRVGHPVR